MPTPPSSCCAAEKGKKKKKEKTKEKKSAKSDSKKTSKKMVKQKSLDKPLDMIVVDCDNPLSAAGIDIDTGRTSSSTKKAKQKPEKENKPTKRESASKSDAKTANPMFDAAGSSESDEEESPTGSFASAKAARKKQMQT